MATGATPSFEQIEPGSSRFWAWLMAQMQEQSEALSDIKGALIGSMGRPGLIGEHEELKKRVEALEHGRVHRNGGRREKTIRIALHLGSGSAGAIALWLAHTLLQHLK